MEFQMAMKDFENMVIEQGELEISGNDPPEKKKYHHLDIQMKVSKENGEIILSWQKKDPVNSPCLHNIKIICGWSN